MTLTTRGHHTEPQSTLAAVEIPKLVVFDVDGTLLDEAGSCPPRTRATLDRLRANGLAVAIATGRPLAIAEHTLELIGGADWVACGNGSSLLETATGILHRDACLPDELIEPTVTQLRSRLPGIGFALELERTVIEEPGFARRVPPSPHDAPVDDVLEALRRTPGTVRKIIPFHDAHDADLSALASIVAEVIDDRCEAHFGRLPIVEVALKGDNKAVALQVLVEHLDIEVQNVIAFGDGYNDVEMLEWAGTGVAMGDAHAHVREAADVVTDRIDDGGVAVFLDPILDHLETIR